MLDFHIFFKSYNDESIYLINNKMMIFMIFIIIAFYGRRKFI